MPAMRKPKAYLLTILLFSGLFFLLSVVNAGAVSLHVTANSAGLSLQYNFKSWGSDDVTIAPGDPEKQLALRGIAGRLAHLWIRVDAIEEDQPVPVVDAVIKISALAGTYVYEYPMLLPFGDYGIEAGFFKQTRWESRNAPIEIFLSCAPLRTNYDIALNLGNFFNNAFSGSSTLKNNILHETIALPGDTMTEQRTLDLTIFPVKTIPLTFFIYSGEVYDDNDTVIQQLFGFIPFPNGSYHVWLTPGFDINELFAPQTQACCLGESQPCLDMPSYVCESMGGIPQGEGSTCATVDCATVPFSAMCR